MNTGTMTQRKRRWLIGIPAGIVLLTVVIFAVIPPLVINNMVNLHVTFAQTWTGAEQGLTPERLVLTTQDGLDIVAYEVYAENPKAVVIFLSGIHNPSVTTFFGHARMLLDEGYASILLEMRAHGESDGDVIALGFKEHRDTRAVVDYIRANPRYAETPIVVYGLSMGGAVAINSIGQIPDIDALISLSAYSAWDDLFLDNMGASGLVAAVQRPFVRLYTGIKYGWANHSINPKDEIQKLDGRPALLIHSRGDTQVPYANFERLVAHAPAHVETWVREGDLHFIVREGLFPTPHEDTEYAERILGFLNGHFAP
jgi:pimeloyl-ACP methyl ester carboxylesterase